MRTATMTTTAPAVCLAIFLSVMSATAAFGAPADAAALPAAPAATQPSERGEIAPSTQPAAVEKPAAAQPAVERGEGEKESARNIRFQFAGVPFATVVRRFASMADKPLIGDLEIQGDLTFFDSQPYTFDEAFDTLNLLLSMRGFWLVEKGRHLQLVPVSQLPSAARFVPGAGDAEPGPRPGEMVTMVVPLKFLDANTASNLVVRRVSPYGSIGPLPTGRGLAITDRFENIQSIRKFLSHFDKETSTEDRFRMVVLKKAKASQVAGVINALMKQALEARRLMHAGQQMPPLKSFVTASHDDRTNMLILTGSGENLALAEQLIASLDVEVDQPGTSEFRVFQLKHTLAADVAGKLGTMLPRTPVVQVQGKPPVGGQLQAKVLPDPATNRLLVSAPSEQMAMIEKLIRELDVEATVTDGGARIFALKVADASLLAGVISGAVRRKDPKGQLQPVLAVTGDTRTNSLVVLGEAGDIDLAARLIKELDVEPSRESPREIHVVQLEAGDARSLAGSLVRLFTGQTSRRPRTDATALHVEAEPATNSLIISAAQADWPIVQGILTQLKASVENIAAPVIRLAPLKFAKADELAGVLRAISATRYRRPGQQDAVPVQISPFPRGNSLLISAAEQDQQILADLIRAMDVEKSEEIDPVRIIRLESADPEELVAHIRSMLPSVPPGRSPEIFIQADKPSRSVLLRAPESRRKEIEELIARLDDSRKLFAREIRMLPVGKASAKDLAAVVSQMYPSRQRAGRPRWERSGEAEQDDPDRVIVTASPNDKLLIVDAPKRKIEEIVQLIASLDIEGPARMHVRTYALGQSNARDLARSLDRLFSRRDPSKPQPSFEADTPTGQLIVAATDEQFEEIDKLVASLAIKAKIASKTQRFPLKHVKASDIVPIMRAMMVKTESSRREEYYWWSGYEPQQSDEKPEVKIAALPGDKSVIVKGPEEALAMAGEIIAQLDTLENSTISAIRIVRLKNARARSLAESVNASLRDRSQQGNPPKVTVTAEDNSNSVLVRGPIADVPAVLAMIKELDAGSSETGIQVRIYPLKNTDAVELSDSIGRLFRDVSRQMRSTRSDAPAPPFSIAADERTNSLIVSTSPSHFAIVEEILANLDKETQRPDRDVEYVVLKNADAYDIARKLRALFRDRRLADQPVIETDFYTNTLTLIGREQDLRLMRPIIDKIEKVSEKIQVRVVPLTHMNAARIAETIKRLYGQMSDSEIIIRQGDTDKGADKDDAGGETVYSVPSELESPLETDSAKPAESDPPKRPSVTIAVDTKSNALILSGPRQELDNIESLISQLMYTRGEGEAEIRIFELKQADPMSVAQTLEQLFNPRQTTDVPQPARRGGGTTQPATPQPIKLPPPTITVAPDLRTRSLIIRAKPADFEIIEPLIRKLDTVSTVVSELRVFTLKNTDATEAAANLNDLFRLSAAKPATGEDKPQQQRADMIRKMIELRHKDGVTKVDASAPVSISANRRTNSVIVSAPPDAMKLIGDILSELDQSAVQGKATQTLVQLKHAQAASVAASLAQAFAPPRGERVTPDDLVKVVAEPISNSIIVIANAENLQKVKGLLKELDTETAGGQTELLLLRNARATDLAAVLSRVAAGEPGRGRQVRQGVIVSAEAASNALVMTGPAGEIDKLMKMAQQLDQASVTAASKVYIIPLVNGSAVEAAATVLELYRQQAQAALRDHKSIDPLAVSADERANAVIVATGEKMYEQVSEWIRRVDAMKPSRGVPRIIHLEHADPAEIKNAIDELFGAGSSKAPPSRQGRRNPSGGDGAGGKVETSVLAKQRALLINASQEDYETILKLIEALDQSAEKSKRQVKVFALKNVANTRVAAALNAMYSAARSPDPRDLVSVSAPAQTSAVVVLAAKEKMEEVAGLIAQLDAEEISPQLEFRIYVLNHAQPTKILPALRQMLQQVQQFRPGETIDVQADERTRSIIVTARKTVFDQVGRIIETLDRKPAFGEAEVLIIPLRRADATRLAEVLNQMLRPSAAGQATPEALALQEQVRRLRVRSTLKEKVPELDLTKPIKIASDPAMPNQQGSNCLIISSTPDNLMAMRQIVQILDTVPVSEGVVVRVLPLAHADALSVMKTLREVFSQGQKTLSGKPGTSVAGKAEPAGVSGKALANPLNVSADLRTNTVIISGIEETAALAEVLVKRMDVKLAHPAVQLEVIPLKHNDAGAIAPLIRTLFQARLTSTTPPGQQPAPRDKVDVADESLTNSLIVSASGENLDLIRNLLKKVDVEPPTETGIVRLYPLINSDAQRVAGMLKGLISQGLYKPGLQSAGADPARAARERVAVEVDVRTNVLIVSASRENFAVIGEIIRTIDATKGFGALGGIRLYTLKRADATRLAPTLQQFFDAKRAAEQAAGASGRSLPTGIIPDARTNTLLVAGGMESFAAVEEMINRLDAEQVTAANVFRVFRLNRATAASLRQTLDTLLRGRVVRGQQRDEITIVADQSQNVLIVGAGAEDMNIVESLITRLDGAPDKAGETLQVFPLQKADATQVANTLRTLYQARGADAGITIGVDERINAIVVSAGGADLQRIGELIERLDSKTVTSVTEIRVFVLRNADATELAKILTDTLTNKPKPLTAVSLNRQTLLQFVTQTAEGRQLVTNALQEGVLITPDARTNSLVVAAPVLNMPLLARLIEAMDSTAPQMAQIRVFTLKNADARSMADVLTSLFRSGTASAAGNGRAVEYELTTTRPSGGAAATVGTAEQDALNITVDSRTNSLLIGGTRRQVEMTASVIEELDSSPAQERLTKVYRLRNARAGDVQTALRGFLDQEQQRLTSTLGADRMGAAHRLLEREVAIVAVASDGEQKNSNTLLLSASPRYFKTVSKMIDELDQPPPQVLIKVLLAEVKLQDETDLGFEWNYRRQLNGKTLATGTNFGVQAAIAGSGSGLSLSVTGSDINLFLRALKAQGRLQILQRPQIMAADNKQGSINIGQRVPFITNSRVTEGGTTLNTIQYEDVGVNLTVTPRINPDGFVKLDIDQKIESLSTSTVKISESVNAVIVDSRTATTTVTVQDGHTIIIGGIITTKDETQEAKVPFLGDIPLLGGLFRSTKLTKERSELLIILTPQVLRGIPDADAATVKQLDRLKRYRELGAEGTRNYLMEFLEMLAGNNANGETWESLLQELKKPATQPARSEALPLESLIEQDQKDRQDKQ